MLHDIEDEPGDDSVTGIVETRETIAFHCCLLLTTAQLHRVTFQEVSVLAVYLFMAWGSVRAFI